MEKTGAMPSDFKAKLYYLRGFFALQMGKYEQAIADYNTSLETYNQLNIENIKVAWAVYKPLGQLYTMQGDFEKALVLLTKSEEILKKYEAYPQLKKVYIEKGIVYKTTQDYDQALLYFNKALEWGSPNDANTAKALDNMGIVYYDLNQLDSALIYYNKALASYKKSKRGQLGEFRMAMGLADIHAKKEDWNKALNYSYTAVEIG